MFESHIRLFSIRTFLKQKNLQFNMAKSKLVYIRKAMIRDADI